jgi:pimeloyl-ACP methyl ester carboxylesterase
VSHVSADPISPPSLLLAMTEMPRALMEAGSLPWSLPALMSAPKGDGHPVLVLPGFVTTDRSTRVLRRYLDRLGYDTHPWKLGRNLGPKAIGADAERLIARLEEVYAETGRKVSLVGWSLGGVMARIVAGRRPELVRQIVTLGSPISGSPKATNAWRAYKILTGQSVDSPEAARLLDERNAVPPVPSTAIFSRNDGIVAWQNCLEPQAETTDNIEVRGSHCGLGVNPVVLYALADRLAQAEGEWKPFDRTKGFRSFVYPSSEVAH